MFSNGFLEFLHIVIQKIPIALPLRIRRYLGLTLGHQTLEELHQLHIGGVVSAAIQAGHIPQVARPMGHLLRICDFHSLCLERLQPTQLRVQFHFEREIALSLVPLDPLVVLEGEGAALICQSFQLPIDVVAADLAQGLLFCLGS